MTRIRLAHVLALLGILITTGGCANSATAPEAAAAEASFNQHNKPAQADTTPGKPGDDGVSAQSGYITIGT